MFAASLPARVPIVDRRPSQRRGSLPLKKRRVAVDVEFAVNGSNSPFFPYHKPVTVAVGKRLPALDSKLELYSFSESNPHHLALLPTQTQPLLINPSPTQTTAPFSSNCNSLSSNKNVNDTSKLTALSLIAAVASQNECLESISLNNQKFREDEDADTDTDDQEEQELILSTALSLSKLENTALPPSHSPTVVMRHSKKGEKLAAHPDSVFGKPHARSQDDNAVPKPHATKATATAAAAVVPAASTGQDKRYTGLEVRCCATTTRGRACAYIAVNDTTFCHMHADYETNPPPRRGIKSPVPSVSTGSLTTINISPKKQVILSKSSSCIKVKSSIDKNHKSAHASTKEPPSSHPPSASPRRSSAKRAEKHADSPYPLLSMISVDQWSQRKVQVAVGPLQGRTGTVQKWGNGWISVKIPGVAGLHNRRSFELYLEDTDDQQQQQQNQRVKSSDKSSKKKRKAKADLPADAMGLFRCVSRDVDVVSPSPSTDHSIRSARSFTPKLASSADSHHKNFTPVPDTPTPSTNLSSCNGRNMNCNSFLTPVPQKATTALPKVTPHLSDGSKPVVSLKSTNCDRLQLPDTMMDATSSNKVTVVRPTVVTKASSSI